MWAGASPWDYDKGERISTKSTFKKSPVFLQYAEQLIEYKSCSASSGGQTVGDRRVESTEVLEGVGLGRTFWRWTALKGMVAMCVGWRTCVLGR